MPADGGTEVATPSAVATLIRGSGADRLYVATLDPDAIAVLDAQSDDILGQVRLESQPKSLLVTPDGQTLLVATDDGIDVIDAATLQILHRLHVDGGVRGLFVSGDGTHVYAVDSYEPVLGARILRIDADAGLLSPLPIQIITQPFGMGAGGFLATAVYGDPATRRVTWSRSMPRPVSRDASRHWQPLSAMPHSAAIPRRPGSSTVVTIDCWSWIR